MADTFATDLRLYARTCISDKHKPSFNTEQSRDKWFDTKLVRSFTDYAPIDHTLGFRIELNIEDLSGVDYVSYVNSNYGRIRWYARVIQTQWVNANTTHVTIQVDAWITFCKSVRLDASFVVREHVENDWRSEADPTKAGPYPSYNNLTPEPVDTGDPAIFEGIGADNEDYTPSALIMWTSFEPGSHDAIAGSTLGGVYSGVRARTYNQAALSANANQVSADIADLVAANRGSGILAITQVHSDVITKTSREKNMTKPTADSLEGYKPKNAKCLSYPYSFLSVVNALGEESKYRWEWFSNVAFAQFTLAPIPNILPDILCYARFYNGSLNNDLDGVLLKGFTQCAWTSDAFMSWLTANAGSLISGLGTSAISAGTGNVGGITSIVGTVGAAWDKLTLPNRIHGQLAGNTAIARGRCGFTFRRAFPREDALRKLDSYFDAFGYNVQELKVPNLRTRRYWNYLEIRNPALCGEAPAQFLQEIRNMFESGVTLWHVDRGAVIGDYSMDNRNSYDVGTDPNPPDPGPGPDPEPEPEPSDIAFPFNGQWGTYTVTSEYGPRDYPPDPYHTGIDWAMPIGQSIWAANDGTVSRTGVDPYGYGNYIYVDHGNGVATRYAHLSAIAVVQGATVTKGQEIGKSGNSGLSTGPHLHFEVRINGAHVNPRLYLPK